MRKIIYFLVALIIIVCLYAACSLSPAVSDVPKQGTVSSDTVALDNLK